MAIKHFLKHKTSPGLSQDQTKGNAWETMFDSDSIMVETAQNPAAKNVFGLVTLRFVHDNFSNITYTKLKFSTVVEL